MTVCIQYYVPLLKLKEGITSFSYHSLVVFETKKQIHFHKIQRLQLSVQPLFIALYFTKGICTTSFIATIHSTNIYCEKGIYLLQIFSVMICFWISFVRKKPISDNVTILLLLFCMYNVFPFLIIVDVYSFKFNLFPNNRDGNLFLCRVNDPKV